MPKHYAAAASETTRGRITAWAICTRKEADMKTVVFFKASVVAGLVLAGVLAYSQQAFAWSAAAHTFMTEQFAHKDKQNVIYGSYSPDIFSYEFDPCFVGLDDQFHHDFMPVWDSALCEPSVPPNAAAFGFVAHNDTWGEDATAHNAVPELGQANGYIMVKAEELLDILKGVPEYSELDIPDEIGLVIAHEMVENSVDILVTRLDPKVGRKITESAQGRSIKFPGLLADAYAPWYAACAGIDEATASGVIIFAEEQFRRNMMVYGVFLSQDEQLAILLIAQQMAEIAEAFFAAYGIELPPGTDLVPLTVFAIEQGMDLCEDDFEAELNATAGYVKDNLDTIGISY